MQAKSQFLANMSHEIWTPMNSVPGTAELPLGSRLDQMQRDQTRAIRDNAPAVLTIINDILEFCKIKAGLSETAPDAVNRCDVVDTGIGIPPARIKALLHPFSQVDISKTRRYSLTGLGLSIVESGCSSSNRPCSIVSSISSTLASALSPVSAASSGL